MTVQRAFDELHFGQGRTLDLHASSPTAAQAADRAEAWLRERQATVGGEVLIVTGRGKGSDGGVAVVRPAVHQRIARLRTQGVVSDVREHTAGSLVVTLASMRELTAATRTQKDVPAEAQAPPLAGLAPQTSAALRTLATHTLQDLGTHITEVLIADEMTRQFTRLAAETGSGPNREARLRKAILAAQRAIDDA